MQAEAEAALSRVADHPVAVTCAGRTDAGVHALGQVIHFDTEAARSLRSWVLGANANLPNDIVVRWAARVDAEFHARYSALSRSYRYVVLNRATRPAVDAGRVAWVLEPLDVGAMQQAARCLVGEHDFSAFRAAQCQAKSPVRRLTALHVQRRGEPDRVSRYRQRLPAPHGAQPGRHAARRGGHEREPAWVAGRRFGQRERAEAGIRLRPMGCTSIRSATRRALGCPARAVRRGIPLSSASRPRPARRADAGPLPRQRRGFR